MVLPIAVVMTTGAAAIRWTVPVPVPMAVLAPIFATVFPPVLPSILPAIFSAVLATRRLVGFAGDGGGGQQRAGHECGSQQV